MDSDPGYSASRLSMSSPQCVGGVAGVRFQRLILEVQPEQAAPLLLFLLKHTLGSLQL